MLDFRGVHHFFMTSLNFNLNNICRTELAERCSASNSRKQTCVQMIPGVAPNLNFEDDQIDKPFFNETMRRASCTEKRFTCLDFFSKPMGPSSMIHNETHRVAN